jgi:hypothetical protein
MIDFRPEDAIVTSLQVLRVNGRFLYVRLVADLAELNEAEQRMLGVLARHGETVFVAVGPDSAHVRFSYRIPDLENAVALDVDGLHGLIQQWHGWANASDSVAS